jgi:DNA-binding CsgD family transcriptional regulator
MKRFTTARRQIYQAHFIQEYLLHKKEGKIIDAIAQKFGIAPSTIRNLIRPNKLKAEIKAGMYSKLENYQSIV